MVGFKNTFPTRRYIKEKSAKYSARRLANHLKARLSDLFVMEQKQDQSMIIYLLMISPVSQPLILSIYRRIQHRMERLDITGIRTKIIWM